MDWYLHILPVASFFVQVDVFENGFWQDYGRTTGFPAALACCIRMASGALCILRKQKVYELEA